VTYCGYLGSDVIDVRALLLTNHVAACSVRVASICS